LLCVQKTKSRPVCWAALFADSSTALALLRADRADQLVLPLAKDEGQNGNKANKDEGHHR